MSGTAHLVPGAARSGRLTLGIILAVVIVAGIAMWLGGWDFTVRQVKTALGWYPLRVTYEVTVEGEPVRIEQIIECYRRFDFSRFFAEDQPSWTQSAYFIPYRLKSGAWFGIVSGALCYRKERYGWRFEDIPTFAVMWTASVDNPTAPHYYSVDYGYYSSEGPDAASHKIAIHTLKRNVQRLRWDEVDRPIAQDRLLNGWFPWSHRRGSGKEGVVATALWGSGATLEKSVWRRWLGSEEQMPTLTQPVAVTLTTQQRKAWRELYESSGWNTRRYSVQTRNSPELYGRVIPERLHPGQRSSVPYRYLGERAGVHRWELDEQLSGVQLLWFIARSRWPTDPKIGPGNTMPPQPSYGEQHRVVISGKEFDPGKNGIVFDPATQRLVYLVSPTSIRISLNIRD